MFHCIFFTYKHELCITKTKSLVIIESNQTFREISVAKTPNPASRAQTFSRIRVPYSPKVQSNARCLRDWVPNHIYTICKHK